MKKKTYTFSVKLWLWPGESANWHFVTVPKKIGTEIRENFGAHARGFGSLKVEVTIGKTTWDTSLFPDKISKSYVLPLKAKVRQQEGLFVDDTVKVKLKLL